MNDRNDFEPSVRNSAWWASDTRQAANGRALDQILIKQGKQDAPDLSDIEAVQMGHVMQPTILRLAQNAMKVEVKDADYMLTHPTESWFRSHFDGITADGSILVEAKNYNAATRAKYDFEQGRIPPADYAQLVHEAAVHNVNKVCFAVLFGGQEFKHFVFEISEQEKTDLIQKMAVNWSHVKLGTLPTPESVDQTKLVYPVSTQGVITATQDVEHAIEQLKVLKSKIKELETVYEGWEVQIRNYMTDNEEIRSIDGSTLVSWKSSKSSAKFSTDLFKQAMPDLYKQFVIESAGSRRFLIK